MARAVIATIGEDRPGLVGELTRLVVDMNLNIDDSRMTVLGGEFAVLMSVTGSDELLDELDGKLGELAGAMGLAHLFRRTAERPKVDHQICTVKVEAIDHPGIVHSIASFFSDRSINIRELETETRPAAHTGAPVFSVEMEIEADAGTNLDELESAFRQFCEEADLDGELSAG